MIGFLVGSGVAIGLAVGGRDRLELRILEDLLMYARFAWKLPGFLARKDSVEGGLAMIADRLANREGNFLWIAERAIYGHPASPYLPLLAEAGCELGDLHKMVEQDGLEETLVTLRREGVYVRFEQFKGREPMVVGGREIPVRSEDFYGPSVQRTLETRSSGSTGAPSRNPIDLDHKAAKGPVSMAIKSLQGILDKPIVKIVGSLPESAGFGGALSGGPIAERWFTPVLTPPRKTELRFRLAHHYIVTVARLCGHPVPRPEPLPMKDALKVARWAEEALATRGPCVVHASPSMSLRICLAASTTGIDLTGTTFVAGGEPLTEAKVAGIEAVGARAFGNYHMSEVGMIGAACMQPIGINDHHIMKDHLAVIQASRRVGQTQVDALHVTGLLRTSPRVLLNVEIDDYGLMEERRCGCPLDKLGLHAHLRNVRSFKKLTAEGVTLVGSEMEHVLECELPARFGGTALDYQLAEEEDELGFTRISIIVSPSVPIEDEQAVIDAVLRGLEKASISADLAVRLWNEAGSIRVRRAEPIVGSRGKVLPLRSGIKSTTYVGTPG